MININILSRKQAIFKTRKLERSRLYSNRIFRCGEWRRRSESYEDAAQYAICLYVALVHDGFAAFLQR